jgi:hypothetical protein
MAYNLFGPTCLLKAIAYPIRAQILETNSRKDLFSSSVKTSWVASLK